MSPRSSPARVPGGSPEAWATLRREVQACRRCPRLVRYRERAAREGERRTGAPHWGRPVAGFGDPRARLVVVGLAPGARGANRTGRVFTGDRSASFLMAGLWRHGFADRPTSLSRDDGLVLRDAFITAAVRCVPPENRPLPLEARRCAPYLARELDLLPRARVLLALGAFAFDRLRAIAPSAYGVPAPRTTFAHGRRVTLGPGAPTLWGCFHPSPRNVQTGTFTAGMFDRLLRDVRRALGPEKA